VLVRVVEPATAASEADIRAGDLIVEVAQQRISRGQDVRALIKTERVSGRRFALLTVTREGVRLFKALRLSEQMVDANLSQESR
jgi:serine protease Do